MRCWCGNADLSPFSPDYARCDACQTLVSRSMGEPVDTRVRDDAVDLYGRDYWFGRQTQHLGCPDIVARSRTDLAERCVHWLRTLLAYKLPPAKVLEIGCGHGGFVAMLRQAGYDATGLELSPSIVQFATESFGVPVLTGPIEDQSIPPASLDAIVMMDVMEHLPDPVATLSRCVGLLKPDGVMLVQTPGYPEGTTFDGLTAAGHKFPMMLDPQEHLFLFSRSSAELAMKRAGAAATEFVPAIFDFYDMAFVAGRQAIRQTDVADRDAALGAKPGGLFLRALLDLDDRRLNLLRKYRELRDAPQR